MSIQVRVKDIKGTTGAYSTVEVGSTTTGAPGSSASVTNTGTAIAAVLNFTIPQGATGATGPQGSMGPSGKTAYQSAQSGGYSGTEAQFNADLASVSGLEALLAALR